jgi:hypothetical protein
MSRLLDNLRSELVRLLRQRRRPSIPDVVADGEISNSAAPLDWLKRANSFPGRGFFSRMFRPMLASLRTYKDAGEIERIRHATGRLDCSPFCSHAHGKVQASPSARFPP